MANNVIEKDTGKDCPNCGGVIYAHVQKSGSSEKVEFHSCKMCGAHWTDDWTPTRPGRMQVGRQQERYKVKPVLTKRNFRLNQMPGWVWMVAVILIALIVMRLPVLLGLINWVFGLLTLVILGYIVYRIGKEQRWW